MQEASIAPPAGCAALCTEQGKRELTLIARAALAGVTVHAATNDFGRREWIASRWHLTRAFTSLDELAAWLERVDGQGEEAVA